MCQRLGNRHWETFVFVLKNTEFILRGYLIVFIYMKSLPIPFDHGDNVGHDAMILNAPIV
jgi:hypothetical protein